MITRKRTNKCDLYKQNKKQEVKKMARKSVVKFIALLLAVMMSAALFAGCGNAKEGETRNTASGETTAKTEAPPEGNLPSWQTDTSPVTFTILVGDNSFTHKWGEDPVSKKITEKTGVNLDIQIPNGEVGELVSTMIAAKDLPDLILMSSSGQKQWVDLIDGALVYSLNELADKYDPSFYDTASKQILAWHARPDGKTYWYPSYAYDMEHITKYKDRFTGYFSFFVRKDMYEGIGSPDMRTPDGWLNALVAVREKFPKVNGQPVQMMGTYGFGEDGNWTFDELLQNCLNIPYEIDNKWFDRRTDPDYRNWFKAFRKAYELGLFTKTMMVENWDQTKERLARGEFFSMLGMQDDFVQTFTDLAARDPDSTYIPVDPPANSKLDNPLFTGGSMNGWVRIGVTTKCKNPERAIKFITYLIGEEGQRDLYLGIEGQTWEMRDGKQKLKKEVDDANKAGWNDVRKYGAGRTWHIFSQPNITNQWIYPEDDVQVTVMTPFQEYFSKIGVTPMPYTSGISLESNSEEESISLKMNLKFGELLPKLIIAKTDEEVDRLWADYDAYAKEINYQKVLDYKTKTLVENKEKLGLID